MRRVSTLLVALALGCSSSNFDVASDRDLDHADSDAPIDETGGPDTGASPPPDTGASPPPDTGASPPSDTGASPPPDTGVSPPADTGVSPPPDTGVSPPTDTGVKDTAPPPDVSIPPGSIIFPSGGDTWYGTPNKLLAVGDGVRSIRTISGGQTKGSGTLTICGELTTSAQRTLRLTIDGSTVLWEKKIYPGDCTPFAFSFTLPSPLTAGLHGIEWRVVELTACASLATCGPHPFPNGAASVKFE